ncbi:alpha/beta hydrolase [Streptomyces sp. NBC_01451]|uniref:alpha/beta hydrolase n=1 Tax=Streptomyces sp. NBC_01451 TaxID=2903872 RepID=UPI002E2EE3CE|nr:alpha/beta hydrolase-fold protein [Streptomyces sp. NBC_01451]
MSLTGTPFLLTTIALVAVAVLLPLALWSRVRGPALVRGAARLLMVLFAQATAVTLVFLLVNNSNNLYDNWGDLLGTGDHVQAAADLGPDGTGGISLRRLPKVRQTFREADGPGMHAAGGVEVTDLRGQVSGVDAEVYVWLPPQYHQAAYRHRRFPVVELLPGYPGSAKSWFGSLHAPQQLLPLMRSGQITPFILVSPRTTLIADADTGCANIAGRVDADTWLSVDVPKMVTDNFRAEGGPGGWAVAGYSAGAHCAAKLAVAHPDRYRAAVSMSGYNDPAGEPLSLAARTPQLRAANNPYLILKHDRVPPAVALYVSGESGDGYEAGLALQKVAKAPTAVDVVYLPRSDGGHNMALWRPQITTVFRWLTQQFDAGGRKASDGLATGSTRRTPRHEPSTAGATHAELASGTASRAAAVRKP